MVSLDEKQVQFRDQFWDDMDAARGTTMHVIMVATKPDIIKQAPLYLEIKKRGHNVVLIHTGQHYDYNLSEGVLHEFGMNVDINLNIFGNLHKKYSLIIERLGDIFEKMINEYNLLPIPYVHGDTLTATTADKAAFLNKISVVHVEAGIRTFTPKKEFYNKLFNDYAAGNFNWEEYYNSLQNKEIYELGSIEPYPEQFDTRSIFPATAVYTAPHELYVETLTDEGAIQDNIYLAGNTIADAVEISSKKIPESKAFEYFPTMKGKDFVFITIHRRENCEVEERFKAIFFGIKKMIENGMNVCFLSLNASKMAIERYGLKEELNTLIENYSNNFVYGEALAHHHEVIDMISVAGAIMTDSGSMQEEANIVGTPCITVRFGSDRTETILSGANVIAPPVNSDLIYEIAKGATGNTSMKKDNIYGKNVSQKIVDAVENKLNKDGKLFLFDHERLDLQKYFSY